MFQRKGPGSWRLKESAVPTLFPWVKPKHIRKPPEARGRDDPLEIKNKIAKEAVRLDHNYAKLERDSEESSQHETDKTENNSMLAFVSNSGQESSEQTITDGYPINLDIGANEEAMQVNHESLQEELRAEKASRLRLESKYFKLLERKRKLQAKFKKQKVEKSKRVK
jgi:hypothetical protein